MKDLIKYIAQRLVDHPEQVEVTAIEGSQTTVLELSVADGDLGMVIGKQGRLAQALRVLLAAASGNRGKRYILEIVE